MAEIDKPYVESRANDWVKRVKDLLSAAEQGIRICTETG